MICNPNIFEIIQNYIILRGYLEYCHEILLNQHSPHTIPPAIRAMNDQP